MTDNFYVVTMISNPVRYKSRYNLYHMFKKQMEQAKVKLVTVEIAFGARPFEVTTATDPMHVQLRTIEELWHKENALNIGINYIMQLDPNAKYIAWIDADVIPTRPVDEWIEETAHALQHYQVVQMFKTAYDLDHKHNVIGAPQISFMSQYVNSGYKLPSKGGFWKDYYSNAHGHPGYAWAANVDALSSLGGLIDYAILGAGDRHMALGLIGCMNQSFETKDVGYVKKLLEWQHRANRWVKRDVGYVDGSIYHYFHGHKQDRGYVSRWKILVDNKFNPDYDIKPDVQGLLQLETYDERQIMLRDQIRSYFRQRNEDAV